MQPDRVQWDADAPGEVAASELKELCQQSSLLDWVFANAGEPDLEPTGLGNYFRRIIFFMITITIIAKLTKKNLTERIIFS